MLLLYSFFNFKIDGARLVVSGVVCEAVMVMSTVVVEIRMISGGRRWEWSVKGLHKGDVCRFPTVWKGVGVVGRIHRREEGSLHRLPS